MENNNINYSWAEMSKEDILEKYMQEISKMKDYAKRFDISDSELNELFHECIKKRSNLHWCFLLIYSITKYVVITILFIFVLYFIISHHIPLSSFFIRNAQGWIYPGFKLWRKLSLPIIKHFPSLTEFYDESCLIRNPFYLTMPNDCQACEQVKIIPDFSTMDLDKIAGYGQPFFVQTIQSEVSLKKLKNFYDNNKKIFMRDAPRIYSSNLSIQALDEMMDSLNFVLNDNIHYLWRINRMSAGRVLRNIFPRPYVIPNLGQSTERFVMILGKNVMLHLPETDCFNVFILQIYGYRNIILKPSPACKLCKPVSVIMKPSYTLVFNRLHYQAISLPNEMKKSESISFIGSYC